jgi:hypothetical protein
MPKNNEKPLVIFLLMLFKTSTPANQPNLKTNLFFKKKREREREREKFFILIEH